MKYATKSSKSSKSKSRPYKRTYKKSSKSFVKKVQAIIHKDVETKQAYNALALTAFNSGIDAVGDVIQVVPNILNGNTDNTRIGDQLRGMSLRIKGHMISSVLPNPNTSSANCRIAVRMMVVQPRYLSNYNQASSSAAVWLPGLLKKGGTTTAFTGVISDLYAPINTDLIIKYYDKVVYVTIPFTQYALSGVIGSTNINNTVSIDLVNSTKFFNINLKMKNKLLKYDVNISNVQPTNYAPCFLLGYCHLDGSSPDVLNTQVSCAFDAIFGFEDA